MKGIRARQRGAVVVYMAAMVAVMAMMVLSLYNNGDAATKKITCKVQQALWRAALRCLRGVV